MFIGLLTEFSGQEVVFAMRQDHCAAEVQIVHDIHIVFVSSGVLYSIHHARKFCLAGFGEEQLVAKLEVFFGRVPEPVGAGHGYRGGGEEEQLVEALEDGCVGVKAEDTVVLGLIDSEELGVAGGPGR